MNKWDEYFIKMAKVVASRSSCLSRQIGVVVVKDEKFPVSTGYNGPPMHIGHCGDEEARSSLWSLIAKTHCL